jgi:magnesium transporter
MANIYSNILSGMMDAFASIISNNLNIVMKFLTAITIILMIPNLIASIYGMNIGLPLQDNPMVFIFLVVFSIWLSFMVVLAFLRKELL